VSARDESDPYFIAGMADGYFDQTHRDPPTIDGYVRSRVRAYNRLTADELAEQRERAREAWVDDNGQDPDAWPLPHPTAVVWARGDAAGLCLRCDYLGSFSTSASTAAKAARRHARKHAADAALAEQYPPLVWSEANRPIAVGDIVFVRQPYVTDDASPPLWGWCRSCGTAGVVDGTNTAEDDSDTDFYCAQWSSSHSCGDVEVNDDTQ